MANRARAAAAVAIVLLLGHTARAAESSTGAADSATDNGHVRSESPVIASAIQDAINGSATFRKLVATIDASDSYVFVRTGNCDHGVQACFVSVRTAGSHRFMFVTIDPTERGTELIRSLGHELRHTIEAIDEPSVRSDVDKYFLYQSIGRRSIGGSRETVAAQDAGNAVLSEVEKFNRKAKSK
jgi:hypothetical protein